MQFITLVFDEYQESLNDSLKEIYVDLKQTKDVKMKLKLSVPFISLLGINLETEFDVKSWITKMYEKYEIRIFKLMGYL